MGVDVPDSVPRSESNPLRHRAVLLLRSGKLLLRSEGLVALFNDPTSAFHVFTADSFGSTRRPGLPPEGAQATIESDHQIVTSSKTAQGEQHTGILIVVTCRVDVVLWR